MSRVPRIRFKGFEEDWEQRKLGEIVGIYDGVHQTPKYQDNGIMFLSVENIATLQSTKYISEDNFKRDYKVYPQENDILMTRIGDVGTTNVIADKGLKAYYVSLALLKYKSTNPYFLSNAIQSEYVKKELANRTLKTAIPMKINKDEIGKVDVMLPISVQEQNKIGEYFRNIDHLITLHQRKLEKLKIIKKSMLENLFPQNGEKTPKIRFSGFTKDWEQRKLGEIAERIVRKNEKLESTLPLTISAQYGLIDQNEFFDKRIASKDVRGYYLIKKGEFAYNKSTSVDAPFGAIKRLDKYKNGVLSTLYILFKVIDDTSTCSDYLVTYYFTDLWHKGIQSIAAEGARNHGLLNIAPNDFFETMLSIPLNVSEQKKVGGFFISLDHLITLHQSKLEKLQKIKKSMLECMFI